MENRGDGEGFHQQYPPQEPSWDPSLQDDTDELDDEPRWTELQLASRAGDLQRVTAILSWSTHTNDPEAQASVVNAPPVGYYGQTALQAACMCGHKAIVEVLLAAGADIHAAGGNNVYRNPNAFELACGAGDLAIFRLLLDAGAEVNPARVTRYQGRTPVQAAAEGGHTKIVALLLGLGANVNAPASASCGKTALQAAAEGQHAGLVKLLLDRGADVNASAGKFSGYSALQAASLVGNMEIVTILLQNGVDFDASGSVLGGGTALHAAAEGGHLNVVRRLLEAGADPNSVAGRTRQTPLQSAFLLGRTAIVDLLKKAGANGPATGGKILFTDAMRIDVWSI